MKSKFVIAILIISQSVFAQWQILTTLNSTYSLHSIFAFSTGVIYINTSNSDIIYKSTNHGLNWFLQNPAGVGGMSRFSFVNELTGFTIGSYISKTTNGGINWYNIYGNGNDIEFVNANTGFWVEESGTHIYKTTDGGLTSTNYWTGQLQPITIDMLNEYTGWVCGYGNYTLKTTNGGLSWGTRMTSGALSKNSVSFIDSLNGIAVGNSRYFSRTTDGGNYWFNITAPLYAGYNEVKFISSDILYVVGDMGVIVKSTDRGYNWYQQTSETNNNLYDFYFINDNTGYIVGSGGIVLKTTNGGEPVGIEPVNNKIPDKFELYQNYPNPFNPETKIQFSISPNETNANTRLIVYNSAGQNITTLFDEMIPAGSYSVRWDAGDHPSGLYFYQLINSKKIISKKMILIK